MRQLGCSIFPENPHIVMTIIRASLGLFVPCSRRPGCRQVIEAVPVHTIYNRQEQFRRTLDSEQLYFLGSER